MHEKNKEYIDFLAKHDQFNFLKTTQARIQKVLSEGSKFDSFLIMRERGSKDYEKWAIIGPPAKRHLKLHRL